jgi:GT2 family glycosyltransferase
MKLSVVIVNYNVRRFLEQCLHSLLKATQGLDVEIFVVDNASKDDSVPYLSNLFPSVRFIANEVNQGFARANNQAIRLAKGEYVLLLNPDTMIAEDTLTTCIEFLDTHSEAGGVGVRMLKPNGGFALESRRGLPSPFTAFCKMSGLCERYPLSHTFGRYYMRYLDEHRVNSIEIISGAFGCFRHNLLEKVGLLDEDFFMYGEDIDLSYRILLEGFSNYYIPTPILHYKGESTQKNSFRYVHRFYKSMLIFFNKHYSHYRIWFAMPIRIAIYFRAFLVFLGQQTERVQNLLGIIPKEKPGTPHYLLVGSSEMIAQTSALLKRENYTFDTLEANELSLPLGHLSVPNLPHPLSDYDFLVYDTDAYSCKQLFVIMEASCAKCPTPLFGTYSVQSKALITPYQIIE